MVGEVVVVEGVADYFEDVLLDVIGNFFPVAFDVLEVGIGGTVAE